MTAKEALEIFEARHEYLQQKDAHGLILQKEERRELAVLKCIEQLLVGRPLA